MKTMSPFAPAISDSAHVIVFGNEKGGSGKSTAAMHVAIALCRMGYKVGSLDLDARQGTFSRYLANRFKQVGKTLQPLPSPIHIPIEFSNQDSKAGARSEESWRFQTALHELNIAGCDFIIIDTPGSDNYMTRLAHSYADTLITPVNDSFIDMDLLARLDPETQEYKGPSVYSRMVWEQRKERMKRDGRDIDWIVMRNRLPHLDAKNKKSLAPLLEKLAQRQNFRIAPGFGERALFRELFLKGMTLLDLQDDPDVKMTMLHVAARQEVRALIDALDPEKLVQSHQESSRKVA